jgi:hypothetical protein
METAGRVGSRHWKEGGGPPEQPGRLLEVAGGGLLIVSC